MSRIILTGDTHGVIDIGKIEDFREHEDAAGLTRDDYMIITGDCGCCWFGDPLPGTHLYSALKHQGYLDYDYDVQCFWKSCPWTTLFVDGNHENHDLLDGYPVEMWNGGKIHRINEGLIHLMRGQVYEIDGKRIFAMGGAESTDKEYRQKGLSWWAREMPSEEEYEEALRNLQACDFKVDCVITHCAPEEIVRNQEPFFRRKSNQLTEFLTSLIEEHHLQYKMWCWGHYHIDKDLGNMHCLYDRIVELSVD